MTARKKPTVTNMKRNCDDRARRYIVARGVCARCGRTDVPLECAHIIRRRYSWTRTDERNLWAMCRWCHQIVDTHVTQFMALVADTIGWELFVELEDKSKRRERFDWQSELDRWKAMT